MKKLYLNKSTVVVAIIVINLFALFFICNFISYLNSDFALFFVRYIRNTFEGFLFYICSFIPNFSLHSNLIFSIGIILSTVLSVFSYSGTIKGNVAAKRRYNLGIKIALTLLFLLFVFYVPFEIDNHVVTYDELLFSEQKDIVYSEQDLIELNRYLADKIKANMNNFERENGSIKYEGDYIKLAVDNLENIKEDIPYLFGMYPAKVSEIDYNFKRYNSSSIMGNTAPFTVYVDKNMSINDILSTTMHEFAHSKNIQRENEAEYTSFLAGIKSNNNISNYSAYIDAFTNTNYALWEFNANVSDEIEDSVISNCLFYGYDEFCGIYSKDVDRYIDNAKVMYISTYRLKNYKKYKNELEEALSIFYNNNINLKVNNEIVSIEKIMQYIDEDSDYSLKIIVDLNKEVFDNIKPAFKNPNLYHGVYQENKKSEESKLKEDLSNFYFAYIPTTKALFKNQTLEEDYTYERVTRYILNYYKVNGYN